MSIVLSPSVICTFVISTSNNLNFKAKEWRMSKTWIHSRFPIWTPFTSSSRNPLSQLAPISSLWVELIGDFASYTTVTNSPVWMILRKLWYRKIASSIVLEYQTIGASRLSLGILVIRLQNILQKFKIHFISLSYFPGCKVLAHDPTVDLPTHLAHNVMFFKLGLAAAPAKSPIK